MRTEYVAAQPAERISVQVGDHKLEQDDTLRALENTPGNYASTVRFYDLSPVIPPVPGSGMMRPGQDRHPRHVGGLVVINAA